MVKGQVDVGEREQEQVPQARVVAHGEHAPHLRGIGGARVGAGLGQEPEQGGAKGGLAPRLEAFAQVFKTHGTILV